MGGRRWRCRRRIGVSSIRVTRTRRSSSPAIRSSTGTPWPTTAQGCASRCTAASSPRARGEARLRKLEKGCIRVYEEPGPDGKYAIGADTATGRGLDYSAGFVIDLATMAPVAEVHGKLDPDVYAAQLHFLGRWYRHREDRGRISRRLRRTGNDLLARRQGRPARLPQAVPAQPVLTPRPAGAQAVRVSDQREDPPTGDRLPGEVLAGARVPVSARRAPRRDGNVRETHHEPVTASPGGNERRPGDGLGGRLRDVPPVRRTPPPTPTETARNARAGSCIRTR